jgi:6-phosphogluconolactonase
MMKIKKYKDKSALAADFGEMLLKISEKKEVVYIALSGGSTPKVIFDFLASEYRDKIEWHKLRFFWGDERCVGPDHAESNYKMTREHLFNHLPIPPENIFRVEGELSPDVAAIEYEKIIDEVLPQKNNLPAFDLMILGMGDDGHTASIFPYEVHLWSSPLLCEVATHPESGQKRVTLTGKVINNSEQILFLVTGSNKAEKVNEIINETGNYQTYPASLVDKKALWMLDEEAAGLL